MGTASMQEVKTRLKSLESTRKITRAMQLIAEQRSGRARALAEDSRACFDACEAIAHQIARGDARGSAYCRTAQAGRRCIVVLGGDRGLAGGYYAQLLRLVREQAGPEDLLLPVGKKLSAPGAHYPVLTDRFVSAEALTTQDCFSMAEVLHEAYLQGKTDEIVVIYTHYLSALRQEATAKRLLPLMPGKQEFVLFEAPAERLVPEYLGFALCAALFQARASEQAARRNAMDQATKNAEELIDALRLQYNRQRQGAITGQLTEILSGAEEGGMV